MKQYRASQCWGSGFSVTDPDPHKDMPPGSGTAWTDADPDSGGIKPRKYTGSFGEYRTVNTKGSLCSTLCLIICKGVLKFNVIDTYGHFWDPGSTSA